jgi:hypothetical protein
MFYKHIALPEVSYLPIHITVRHLSAQKKAYVMLPLLRKIASPKYYN